MIRKLVHRFLRHRHFWRHATFDELSEIYISSFFRMLAISMVSVFIPIFLFQLGYSLTAIFGFYITYFTIRAVLHLPAGYIVARIGPKHAILASFIFQLCASLSFLTMPTFFWPLWMVAGLWAMANDLFFTAYHVDFSKVKHSEHSGKEMGFADIVQRIAGVVGPIVGGVVATIFGAHYIFLAMIILLVLGVIPLFTSAEPVKTKQRIRFRSLPFRAVRRDILSYTGLTISHQLAVTLWPLYLGLFALGANVYLELGFLSSVGFLVSIFTAYAIGKTVDNKRGRELLRISAVADMFVQFSRPLVNSLPFAFVVNTAGESTGTALRISYLKGMYDAADDLPGNRIVYISIMEACAATVKGLVWVVLLICGVMFSFELAIIVGFMIAGFSNLLTVQEKFKAL